jgi:hypothetical protein
LSEWLVVSHSPVFLPTASGSGLPGRNRDAETPHSHPLGSFYLEVLIMLRFTCLSWAALAAMMLGSLNTAAGAAMQIQQVSRGLSWTIDGDGYWDTNTEIGYYANWGYVGYPSSANPGPYAGGNQYSTVDPQSMTLSGNGYSLARVMWDAASIADSFYDVHFTIDAASDFRISGLLNAYLYEGTFGMDALSSVSLTGGPNGVNKSYTSHGEPLSFDESITLEQGDYELTARGWTGWSAAPSEGAGYADFTFSLQSIPEPSTLALLGIGVMGLLACAWRRRRRPWQAPSGV